MTTDVDFALTLRGYDVAEVDAVLRRAHDALTSDSPDARAAARRELGTTRFRTRLRGYDRGQVDDYLDRLAAQLR